MLTAKQIKDAKENLVLKFPAHYEHDDCIRIAYEWLDAQKKTKNPRNVPHDLKHLITRWASRYVSRSDVEVAAYMHPDIIGDYPYYNISSRLTEPNIKRLVNIDQSNSQDQIIMHQSTDYKMKE